MELQYLNVGHIRDLLWRYGPNNDDQVAFVPLVKGYCAMRNVHRRIWDGTSELVDDPDTPYCGRRLRLSNDSRMLPWRWSIKQEIKLRCQAEALSIIVKGRIENEDHGAPVVKG